MEQVLNRVVARVRRVMSKLAHGLNRATGGKLSANTVTLISFAGHIPIAILIGAGSNVWAAILLVVFGLMDALDGELAQLQGTANAAGMLLDATTDRSKEIVLYAGCAYFLTLTNAPWQAVWAVIACGSSLLVSYVKAKAETAVKDKHLSANQVNRLFGDGIGRFEVRMAVLIIALLFDQLPAGLIIISLLSCYTVCVRLARTTHKLEH